MIEKIRPLQDRVLLKRIEEDQETMRNGIIIPDSSKESGHKARVIAVGPGRLDSNGKLMPVYVKENDTVIVSKYIGTEAGNEMIIVREEDILAVVEK